MSNKYIFSLSLVGCIAIIVVFVVAGTIPIHQTDTAEDVNILITGAATAKITVFEIKTKATSGKIQWKDIKGKSFSMPIAADGSSVAGSSTTEAVLLATKANPGPDDLVYLEGEMCVGTSAVTDCAGAQFIVIQSKKAALFRIKNIDTDKNEIDVEDKTNKKESKEVSYTDGIPTTIVVGEKQITLTINEAANQITFTSIGSSDGATVQLYDRAVLEIINADIGSQTFEGFYFSEYNDGALGSAKYIGQGGNAPLEIEIFYDGENDNSIEISENLITDLTKALGSGWYTTDGTKSFYSNKGTLFTYDEEDKHKLTIGHIGYTKGKKQL